MSKAHSPYGGSQVYRYAACPGSVELIKRAPPQKDSVYAEEGTFAHKLAETCLLAGEETARDRIGKTVEIETAGGPSAKVVSP